jgi:peptide/nickel transport system permease protein
VSALRPGSWADRIVTGAALGALVVPTFVLALLALSFSTYLSVWGDRWMQPGYVGFSQSPAQWLGRMILPWIAVAATQAATTAKLTRTAILDLLVEDYLRTARAKGLSERRIFWWHVLRPASISLITSASAGFGVLLGYAAIVDWVFALGGIGQQLLTAARSSDVMIVMGVVLVTAVLVSVVNFVADICLTVIDPRVHVT